MAPKKGGGSSSSGSGSGSGVNVCPHCDDMIVLRGYRLGRYPQEAAGIAFAGIVLAGFLALFIASLFGKGTLQRPKKKRATKFGLSWALGCLVISQAFSIADNVLHDTFTAVMLVYYIVRPVSDVFYFVPETILPWAILCIIWIRLRVLRGDQGVARAVRGTAIGFLSLLTALSVAITAMDITLTVYYINWDDDNYLALSDAWYGLAITHVALRVLAALIATALATKLFFDSRNSTKPSKIPTFLLALVTPWFLVREIITLAFVVTNYRDVYNGDWAAYHLAREISYGIVTIIIYTGLVLCMFRPEWRYADVEPPTKQNEGYAPGIEVPYGTGQPHVFANGQPYVHA